MPNENSLSGLLHLICNILLHFLISSNCRSVFVFHRKEKKKKVNTSPTINIIRYPALVKMLSSYLALDRMARIDVCFESMTVHTHTVIALNGLRNLCTGNFEGLPSV